MDKSCQSSSSDSNHHHQYLKNLNKLSHKISKKPPPPPFDPPHLLNDDNHNLHQSQPQSQPQQHQPPVYNINKNDFRDVVQKLTGSPAHDRFSNPPPIQPPKPPSSRLQRIRPPPLAHVSNRPPPLLNSALPPPHLPPPPSNNSFVHRPPAPLSPLPPFPSVHAAAESPVSAYMRYLHNNSIPTTTAGGGADSIKEFSGFSPLAPLVSPRWSIQQPIPPPQQTSGMMTSQPQFQLPLSPMPFGCLNSPRSPHPFFSAGLLLSPSAFPVSPTLPVPSPKWRSL